jgi:hypothetical protein
LLLLGLSMLLESTVDVLMMVMIQYLLGPGWTFMYVSFQSQSLYQIVLRRHVRTMDDGI